jgi:hypothetical protein
VTSVLQTTAGKMIFGRYDERVHAIHEKAAAPHPERQERPHVSREHAGSHPGTPAPPSGG